MIALPPTAFVVAPQIAALADIPIIGGLVSVVIPFIIVLAIVIFVHEYGHYIVGRWCGIHSEEFSLGFGPEIFGWVDKRGTRWRVAWVPLGGYVRFKGDADEASAPDAEAVSGMSEEERRSTLPGAPLWARAATVAAGPMANFILSVLVFAGVALAIGAPSEKPVVGDVASGRQAAGAGLQAGDRILSIDGAPVETFSGFVETMLDEQGRPRQVEIERDGVVETLAFSLIQPAKIGRVVPGGAADRACLLPRDVILEVDGKPVANFSDLQAAIIASDEAAVPFKIQRLDASGAPMEPMIVEVSPRRVEHVDPLTGSVEQRVMIGVTAEPTLGLSPEREAVGPVQAIGLGAEGLTRIVSSTLNYLGAWISGRADGSALGGPIGIARASGEAAQEDFIRFIAFIGTVSAAIGFINLFPIPMLDGGHLVFYAVEAVRGRPLSDRWVEAGFKVGLAAILLLLVFATFQDLSKLWTVVETQC